MAHHQNLEHGSRKPRSNVLEEAAKPQKTDEENFALETTLYSKTQISDMDHAVIDKTNSKGTNLCVKSENFMKNRKRKVFNGKFRTDLKDCHKQSKSAVRKTSEGIISNSIMQNDKNFDSEININPLRETEHEIVQLTGICSELECHSENQDVQKFNFIENKIPLTSDQNNADKSDKTSDSNAFNTKIKFSIDYILAIPGPSNSSEKISQSNFSEQNIEDRTPSIEKTQEERKDLSMSLACKKKATSSHIEVLEALYGNFQREYKKVDEVYRPRKIYCHENEITCDVCEKVFQYLSELEDHYLDHEDYHSRFCRICKSDIDEHRAASKWKGKLKCCYQKCTYEINHLRSFRYHLYTHSIFKLFKCKFCGKRFRHQSALWTHSKTHAKCEISGKTFVDGYSLDSNCSEH